MVIIGSITGNRNTIAGNIPPQADLGNLEGFKAGFKYPNVMINGGEWEAPKAYKDAKVCPLCPRLHHLPCALASSARSYCGVLLSGALLPAAKFGSGAT